MRTDFGVITKALYSLPQYSKISQDPQFLTKSPLPHEVNLEVPPDILCPHCRATLLVASQTSLSYIPYPETLQKAIQELNMGDSIKDLMGYFRHALRAHPFLLDHFDNSANRATYFSTLTQLQKNPFFNLTLTVDNNNQNMRFHSTPLNIPLYSIMNNQFLIPFCENCLSDLPLVPNVNFYEVFTNYSQAFDDYYRRHRPILDEGFEPSFINLSNDEAPELIQLFYQASYAFTGFALSYLLTIAFNPAYARPASFINTLRPSLLL